MRQALTEAAALVLLGFCYALGEEGARALVERYRAKQEPEPEPEPVACPYCGGSGQVPNKR